MSKAAILLAIYALLLFIGGLMGYIKAGSCMSLIMGAGFGILLLGAAFALFKQKVMGIWIALCLVFLIDAFFTYRFLKTMHFFPAGFFSLLSLAMLILLVSWLRKKPT